MSRLYYWQNDTKEEERERVATSPTPLVMKDLLKEIENLKNQLVYKENVIESLKKQFVPNFNINSSTSSKDDNIETIIFQLQTDFYNDLRDLISVVSSLK